MVAVYKGFYEIVRILLEKEADVNKLNESSQTCILFCFSRMEEQRYKYENKKICLMMIDLLMEGGADINIRVDSTTGYTILMKLVSVENMDYEKFENTVEIVKFLLERGAEPYIKGYDGLTALDLIKGSYYQEELTNVLLGSKQTVFFNSNSLSMNIKKPEVDYEVLLFKEKKKFSCCDMFYN